MFSRSAALTWALCRGVFYRQPHAAPQIGLPTHAERERESLRRAAKRVRVACRSSVWVDRRSRTDGGVVIGVIAGSPCARLAELRLRLLDVLVVDVDQLFQTVQLRIAEYLPPFALEHSSLGVAIFH